jgi:gamma-glutamylcyclotransferase (GGCT)/AIG2-like uncharacterized protein YtfP
MPLLFSYGTLQDEQVQRATFGRTLRGERDALPGFERSLVKIEGEIAPTIAGGTHHANVIPSSAAGSQVAGTVFDVTDAELASADAFEAPAQYQRIEVSLASGKRAWLYVFTHPASTDR